MNTIEVRPSSRRTLQVGLAISAVLFVIHTITKLLGEYVGFGEIQILSLGSDSAIPTWFAAAMLFTAALGFGLRWLVARSDAESDQWRWLGLAIVFTLLSIDEVGTIHEWVGNQMSDRFGERDGLLTYQWIIAGAPLAAAVTAWYAPFVLRLETRARNFFLIGGMLFVGGAIVIEAFNGKLDAEGQSQSLRYGIQTGFEELAEFAGTAFFVAAAARVVELTGWTLRFAPDNAADGAADGSVDSLS